MTLLNSTLCMCRIKLLWIVHDITVSGTTESVPTDHYSTFRHIHRWRSVVIVSERRPNRRSQSRDRQVRIESPTYVDVTGYGWKLCGPVRNPVFTITSVVAKRFRLRTGLDSRHPAAVGSGLRDRVLRRHEQDARTSRSTAVRGRQSVRSRWVGFHTRTRV